MDGGKDTMEIRRDALHGRPVIFSPGRADRPDEVPGEAAGGARDDCPFCHGNEDMTPPTIAARGEPWTVRLFENKFPALSDDEDRGAFAGDLDDAMPAHGRHEILVEGGDHVPFHALDRDTGKEALHLLQDRYTELVERDGVAHVLVFKNSGEQAGASIPHPHTQITAAPVTPSLLRTEARQHERYDGDCLLCDEHDAERCGDRAVHDGDTFTAYCPWASAWPYEIRIVPTRHVTGFDGLTPDEIDDLADLLQRFAGAYHDELGDPAFNVLYHSFPDGDGHFHLEMFPREKDLAGAELSGLPINEVLPGEAAAVLQDG
ncbi:MAG: hypothetical protein ABEK12_03510 [Candidatus Nanohaloarchaea archaeon]